MDNMTEAQHIPVVIQLAAIQIALQFFKDRIPHNEWETTPLPLIAAPGAWLEGVRDFLCAEDGTEPAEIYGCDVVRKDELEWPVLITHDGKAYRVNDFAAQHVAQVAMSEEQKKDNPLVLPEPVTVH